MEQARYNLVIPMELYNEVKQVADSRSTTVKDILRRFIALGLLAAQIEEDPGAALIVREGESESRIVFY